MIRGLITARITGANITETLRRAADKGVTLLCTVFREELTVQVTVLRQDYRLLREVCEKQGDRLEILVRTGAYWNLRVLLNRPVLMLGIILVMAWALYIPSRVFFVRVEGNREVPARQILDMARQCGIRFGASRRTVRSERMKNALLEAVPQLQWAGVNTGGCVAVITVRERPGEEAGELHSAPAHIVALTDAVVTSCTASAGTPLCSPGQAVEEGQILISGFTDTGLTIRAEQASGEVYGQTKRQVRAITPLISIHQQKTGARMKKISILLGKKRINLWKDSGIWDITCDRMYEEYYITLPGGFQLPLALSVESFAVTQPIPQEIPPEQAQQLLGQFAERCLMQSMIAGSIASSRVDFEIREEILILAGEYRCTELIGVMQRFQMGE